MTSVLGDEVTTPTAATAATLAPPPAATATTPGSTAKTVEVGDSWGNFKTYDEDLVNTKTKKTTTTTADDDLDASDAHLTDSSDSDDPSLLSPLHLEGRKKGHGWL